MNKCQRQKNMQKENDTTSQTITIEHSTNKQINTIENKQNTTTLSGMNEC